MFNYKQGNPNYELFRRHYSLLPIVTKINISIQP